MLFDKNKIKCIVCDLDGTILRPDATLGDKTAAALQGCRARGIDVLLATGRSVLAAEQYRAQLGLTGPMIYYNGAEVVDMPSAKILTSYFFPHEAAYYCVQLARQRNIHFHIFFIDETDAAVEILMSERDSEAVAGYAERTGLNFQYGNLIEELNAPKTPICAKGLFIADSAELEDVRSLLHKKFGAMLNIVKSSENFLEILHKDASKGNALEAVLKLRGITAQEVIAFGDEENDISMLKAAGFSVAPANAKDMVKAAAKTTCGANSEEGVAAFLQEHLLNS